MQKLGHDPDRQSLSVQLARIYSSAGIWTASVRLHILFDTHAHPGPQQELCSLSSLQGASASATRPLG